MKYALLLMVLLITGAPAIAQKDKANDVVEIRTSSVCDMCERTIEDNLIYEKGVKKVELDLTTSIVRVEYDAHKTTPDAIRVALTKLGYFADDLPGDPKAFQELPACCQKEGCGKAPVEKQ